MATGEFTPSMAARIASDLTIYIYPRDATFYEGTAAQLIAEGLIPDGFKWPTAANHATVTVGKFVHLIFRTRPAGHKGPKSSWTSGDCWRVVRRLANRPRNGFIEPQIYEKKTELAEAIYRGSAAWEKTFHRAFAARQDEGYMAFRTLCLGELAPRKRGLPVKPSTPKQSKAEAA